MTTAEAILSDAFPATGTAQQDVEALVREHSGTVFRAAWSVLRDHHDAWPQKPVVFGRDTLDCGVRINCVLEAASSPSLTRATNRRGSPQPPR